MGAVYRLNGLPLEIWLNELKPKMAAKMAALLKKTKNLENE